MEQAFRCRIFSLVRFGDFGPCVEHMLCGWMFFFVLLNGDVLVGVVAQQPPQGHAGPPEVNHA